MINLKKIFWGTFSLLSLAACSDGRDGLESNYEENDLAVHFSASMNGVLTRAAETSVNVAEGTALKLSRDEGRTYYSYTAGKEGALTPVSDFVQWKSSRESSMNLVACAPAAVGSATTAEYFSLPADQSEGLDVADFSTFKGSVSRSSSDQTNALFNSVSFQLQHRMSQVKLVLSQVDDKYKDCTFDYKIYSPHEEVTLSYGEDGAATVTGKGDAMEVTPYMKAGASDEEASTPIAILTPGAADSEARFIALQAKNASGDEVGTPLYITGIPALASGTSYTFKLNIVNDEISIASVQVNNWISTTIVGTTDVFPSNVFFLDLEEYASDGTDASNVYADLKKAYDAGYSKIVMVGDLHGKTLPFVLRNGQFSIPSTVKQLDLSGVTGITTFDAGILAGTSGLEELEIPETVRTIGSSALYSLSSLKSFTALYVTKVDATAFMDCRSLTSVDLPRVETMSGTVFRGCSSLTQVNLPALKTTGNTLFTNCTSLTEISLPSLTSVPSNLFDCTSLKVVHLDAATELASSVFASCNLTELTLNSLTSLVGGAFSGLTLSELTLPAVTAVASGAFSSANIDVVHLPKALSFADGAFSGANLHQADAPKVQSIGLGVFAGCTKLTVADYPEVISIDGGAFSGCSSLTSVNLPKVKTIGDGALGGCMALTSVEFPLAESLGKTVFSGSRALTTVKLPAALSLGEQAFNGCVALTTVVLPKVTTFGDNIFANCVGTNIDLTLNKASQSENVTITEGDDGVKTYQWKNSDTTTYTLKSITLAE